MANIVRGKKPGKALVLGAKNGSALVPRNLKAVVFTTPNVVKCSHGQKVFVFHELSMTKANKCLWTIRKNAFSMETEFFSQLNLKRFWDKQMFNTELYPLAPIAPIWDSEQRSENKFDDKNSSNNSNKNLKEMKTYFKV